MDRRLFQEGIGYCATNEPPKANNHSEQHTTAQTFNLETHKLRRLLKLYLYQPVKWKNQVISFHVIKFSTMLLQIIKVVVITSLMFSFGSDRYRFKEVVNRGHLTLRHLLLRNWDATWEGVPYPPSQGDFAAYRTADIIDDINFAVERFYNADVDAIGFYVKEPEETMTIEVSMFDFPGFSDDIVTQQGENVKPLFVVKRSFPTNAGLSQTFDPVLKRNKTSYDIDKEFLYNNLTSPIKRLLSIHLNFSLHSVRVKPSEESARCLITEGAVVFDDFENNGQVLIDLEARTQRITCAELGYNIPDAAIERTSKDLGGAMMALAFLSLIITSLGFAFGIFAFIKTRQYMRKYYVQYYNPSDPEEKDLSREEYYRFIPSWNLLIFISDILLIYGTYHILFELERNTWTIGNMDRFTVWLSVGCILAWLNILKIFKFHNRFHLFFNTVKKAIGDVIAYLLCVAVLFLAYQVVGYVVLGPYNVKFETPSEAAETLFSIVYGDEIYATMAFLDVNNDDDDTIWWFCRFYVCTYVIIFTVVALNLLIAIFIGAFDAVKEYYKAQIEERKLRPIEKALKKILRSDHHSGNPFRTGIEELINSHRLLTQEETIVRKELIKLAGISTSGGAKYRPRSLRAFMEDEKDIVKQVKIGCLVISIPLLHKITDCKNTSDLERKRFILSKMASEEESVDLVEKGT